jgi:putative variant cofactor biosynthesis B12-binding/radical SAM domain protein 1
MNILLMQAYLGGTEPPVFPLGLSCLASSIKGHNVKGFDPNIFESPRQELINMLKIFQPDVVGISLRDIDSTNTRKVVFYYRYFRETMDLLKVNSPSHSKIVVGGSGFSMFAREIMQDEPRIDFGVYLEGERTFPELIENLKDPHNIKGVFYRKNGRVLFTGPRNQADLNRLPAPDRTVIDIEPYIGVPEAIGVETKRGCALSCVYCVYGFLNGKMYRLKAPEKVLDEIESLTRDLGVRSFMFVDSVFNIPLSHAEAICGEMIQRRVNVSWSAWFSEKYITEEFVELVKRAGCKKIMLSPDGFSNEVLLGLGKIMRKKDILTTYDMLKKIDGIEICYNFFKNPPAQSLHTFLRLLFFYVKAKLELKNRVHFEFNSIRIEPHTQLCEIALNEGVIDKEDDLLYPKFYSKRDTRYIERIFDLVLRIKGK